MEQNTNLPEMEHLALIGTIEDVPAGTIKNALVRIGVSDEKLMAVRTETDKVLATWDGSKESYDRVKRHRLDNLRPVRTGVVKTAEDGRAEANHVQRLWIKAEKAVVGFIESDETRCFEKEREYERKIQEEQDAIAAKEMARVDAMISKLLTLGWVGNQLEVAQDTPVQFAERLSKAQESFSLIEASRKAEAERKAKEEQEARELAEANRLEAERLAKVKAEQDAAAAKLQKDREDFERQQREAREAEEARQRKVKEDADKAERERLAKIATDEKLAREAAEAETKRLKAIADAKAKEEADAKAAGAERLRLAALAPDKEKILAWLAEIEAVETPELVDGAMDQLMRGTVAEIANLFSDVRAKLK